jgi:folate-binding protein YgfZ
MEPTPAAVGAPAAVGSLSSLLAVAQSSVIVVPEPQRRVLSVTGPDAKSWLNGIVTCDVAATSRTQGSYGLLLSKQGKIQAELDVVESGSGLLLGVVSAPDEDVKAVLDRYLIMEDAELADEPDLTWVRLHGKASLEAAAAIGEARAFGGVDWLGIGGAALALPRGREEAALEPLLGQGSARRLRQDEPEWTLLRIACGAPRFGADFGPEDNPHQAGLERRAVSWTKGCYLGQEVVCMQDMRGKLKRRLVTLAIEGDEPVPAGAEVRLQADGRLAGQISTSSVDATRSLAFARVSAPFFETSEPLEVLGRSARIVGPGGSGDGSFSG